MFFHDRKKQQLGDKVISLFESFKRYYANVPSKYVMNTRYINHRQISCYKTRIVCLYRLIPNTLNFSIIYLPLTSPTVEMI